MKARFIKHKLLLSKKEQHWLSSPELAGQNLVRAFFCQGSTFYSDSPRKGLYLFLRIKDNYFKPGLLHSPFTVSLIGVLRGLW